MDEDLYEQFGRQIDAYVMSDLFDHATLGKTIESCFLLLQVENERRKKADIEG
jgi:hypothetical protein